MKTGGDMIAHWLEQAGRQPLLTAAEELHLGGMVRRWQDHPDGAEAAPLPIKRRGKRARDRMVAANLRLVAHVARRARHGLGIHVPDSEMPDLLQAGAIGLMRGVERFDPARGYKFSTYGYWWIRQGISRWADTSTRTIRLPSTHAPTMGRLGRISAALAEQLGRQPTKPELAAELGMSLADMDHLLLIGAGCHSLDAPLPGSREGEPSTLGELTPARESHADPQRDELLLRIGCLDEQDQRLIRGRWGIGEAAASPTELARREGISIHRLRSRLRIAELRLRRMPSAVGPPPLEESKGTPGEQLSLWTQPEAAQASGPPCCDDESAAD